MLTVEQALTLIEQRAQALPATSVPLGEALGLVLAADAASDIDSPPHDKAMMDGYAVGSGDTSAERRVLEEVFAGGVPSLRVTPGAATRIMTGAPLPEGADTVVPVELTELVDAQTVRVPLPGPAAGKHVMRGGEAIVAGRVVLKSGSRIGASQVALLAETGHAEVNAVPRPSVAVLATGDELVDASQRPGAGQIRNSNGPMLHALISEAGATPVELGVARDEPASLESKLRGGRDCDVLLVSGGVSAGDRDLAPGVLEQLGVEQLFQKVAVKPGKPIFFGVWPREGSRPTCVFGLPGNPVSGYVCFQLFVRPLLSALAGGAFVGLPEVSVRLEQPVSRRGGRETYLPTVATLGNDGLWRATPTAWRGSADLAGLAAANALLRLPPQQADYAAGTRLPALLLRLWPDIPEQNS